MKEDGYYSPSLPNLPPLRTFIRFEGEKIYSILDILYTIIEDNNT